MRVLLFTTDFRPNPGGVAMFLHNLAVQLVDLGHQIDVLCPSRAGDAESDANQPYRVYRYNPSARFSSIVPILQTLAQHRRRTYDIVFVGHMLTTHALGAWALDKGWNVPYAILSHGNDLAYCITTPADKRVARLLLDGASLVLANSRFTADRV